MRSLVQQASTQVHAHVRRLHADWITAKALRDGTAALDAHDIPAAVAVLAAAARVLAGLTDYEQPPTGAARCQVTGCTGTAGVVLDGPRGATRAVCRRCADELTTHGWAIYYPTTKDTIR